MNQDNKRLESQLAEYELMFNDEELDKLYSSLSEMEREELEKLSNLKDTTVENKPFFKELLDVVVKGAIDYVNSMTDISTTFDEMKNSSDVNKHNDEVITKKIKPASRGTEENWKDRTIKEAKKNVFDKNVNVSTDGMSARGKERFEKYNKAYEQRTKTLTRTSKGGNSNNRNDFKANSETLAGIESFRFGPMVPPTPIAELKKMYENDVKAGKADPGNKSKWIRQHNYDKLDSQIMETFGFKNKEEARKFRRENHLTPHEGPDGICLVPSDVHDSAAHNGYASKTRQVLAGEITEEEMNRQLRQEKIDRCKHELSQRGVRMAKGMAMGMIKDTAIFAIGVIGRETYEVFRNNDNKVVDNLKLVMERVWNKIKIKVTQLIKQVGEGLKGNVMNEIFTALNDFLFKTAQNIFRIIRMMWKSLYNALKTIFSSDASWQERLFEATKILAAGAVGVFGITLNEMIEKWLTTIGIPFANVLADILSGLIGGILSAVMLFIFDKLRKNIFENKKVLSQINAEERITTIHDAQLGITTIKTDRHACETLQQFHSVLVGVKPARQHILTTLTSMRNLSLEGNSGIMDAEMDKLLKEEF